MTSSSSSEEERKTKEKIKFTLGCFGLRKKKGVCSVCNCVINEPCVHFLILLFSDKYLRRFHIFHKTTSSRTVEHHVLFNFLGISILYV